MRECERLNKKCLGLSVKKLSITSITAIIQAKYETLDAYKVDNSIL